MKPETKENLKEKCFTVLAGLVVTTFYAVLGLLVSSSIVTLVKIVAIAYAAGGLDLAFITSSTLVGLIAGAIQSMWQLSR